MTADKDICVNDVGEVNQPLNLAALFPAATIAMADIDGVDNLAVMALTAQFAKPNENKCGSRGISIFNPKLSAHQFRDVNTVCAVMPVLMVAGYNAQNLIRNRSEQFHASPQFLHRGSSL